MKWLQTGTIVMTLVLGCQSILAQTGGEIGTVGHFLGNGPWANWSGQWLALLERDGGFELREVTVSSTSNEKPVCGDMGLIVNAPPAVPDALLLRGFPAIKSGRVVTAFHGRKFLLPGEWLNVSLGGDAHWNLQAFGTVRPDLYGGLDAQFTNYQLWMTTGTGSGRRATVFSLDRLSSDKPPRFCGLVIWTGIRSLTSSRILELIITWRTMYCFSLPSHERGSWWQKQHRWLPEVAEALPRST